MDGDNTRKCYIKVMARRLKLLLAVILSVALSAGYAWGGAVEYDTIKYIVQQGDVLGKIAEKHGTTVDSIKTWNGLSDDKINLGQSLSILKPKENKQKEEDKVETVSQKDLSSNEMEENDDSGDGNIGKNGQFLWILLIIGVVGLLLCAFVRAKFWKRIKSKKKTVVIWCAALVFLLVGMMAWKSVRDFFLLIGIISVVLVVVVIVVRYVISKKKQSSQEPIWDETKAASDPKDKISAEDYKRKYEDSERENYALKQKIAQMQKTIENLTKEKEEYLSENISLGERLEALEHSGEKAGDVAVVANELPQKEEFAGESLYAESIVDGYMYRVKDAPSEDSVFELHLKGSSYATFAIYKQAEGRVIANPSYLDGCDMQLLGRSVVKVVRQGEARLDDNGKWKISTKLLVHIE